MRRRYTIMGLVLGIALVFAFFVPVIRFDTNTTPTCARERIPCPLMIRTPITNSGVYWSVTAYYIGIGTYLLPFTNYGFV
jgi:hypothetical protein